MTRADLGGDVDWVASHPPSEEVKKIEINGEYVKYCSKNINDDDDDDDKFNF